MICATEQFGEQYVSRWNFESWNEPKMRHFDGLNMTVKGNHSLVCLCFCSGLYVIMRLAQ